MAATVNMPKLGLQMTSGVITKWLVSEGDVVKKGDPIFTIETDKIVTDVESTVSGTVLKIIVQEGEEAEVMAPCCYVGEPGERLEESGKATEDIKSKQSAEENLDETVPRSVSDTSVRLFATPVARKLADELGIDLVSVKGTGPKGRIQKADILAHQENSRVRITPAARKLAQQYNVDYKAITGSGPSGRIQKEDILAACEAAKATSEHVEKGMPEDEYVKRAMSLMRKTVARRLSQSKQMIPHAYYEDEVDASSMISARDTFKEAMYKKNGNKLTYNDIILKATALALSEFEDINAQIDGDTIRYFMHVNLGVAVSVPAGLLVPVIKNAEEKSISEISRTAYELANRAKNGKLKPDEYTGGTFTVSNLGGYGLERFRAIINPPESGILAIGAIRNKVVVIDGEIVIRPMMSIAGSFDHRLIDGALAAKFMMRLKALLENAYALFV